LSEFLAESGQDILVDIIRNLCMEQDANALIQKFKDEVETLEQDEINKAFSIIDNEGLHFQDNHLVIDFYHTTIQEKLSATTLNQFPQGHPVRVYLEENLYLRGLLSKMDLINP